MATRKPKEGIAGRPEAVSIARWRQLEKERDRLQIELRHERLRSCLLIQRATKDLQRQRHEVQLILDSVPAMIWFKDASNRILRCNRLAAATAGVTVAEMEGAESATFYPDEAAHYHEDDLDVIRTGRPKLGIVEQVMRGGNGEKLWVRTDKVPYYREGGGGRIEGVLVFAVDITPLKRAEEERGELLAREQAARSAAEVAGRKKEEFLATLSHELRTPLTAILGYASLLRSRQLSAVGAEAALEVIERNAHVQAQLIEDLLDVSRIAEGRLRLALGPADLARVIRSAVAAVRPSADAAGIRLHLALRADPAPTTGDVLRLQQIFGNLLSNAVKFTPAGGRIDVLLARQENRLCVQVRDTGRGISPEFLPELWKRFSQAETTIARRWGGLGLGLSIVRSLVELHSGTVRASSPGEGKGATFTVELPWREPTLPEVALEPPGALSAPSLRGLRVLLVEDDPDSRQLLLLVLEESGAVVTAVASVAAALAALDEATPDVLVSDIGLPGADGYELIKNVRSRAAGEGGGIPAVALTAFASGEDQDRALRAGFNRHVAKPVVLNDLIAILASLT